MGLNLSDLSKHDVYRINLKNGAMELDTENPGDIISFTVDSQFQIRVAIAATPDGGYDLCYRESPASTWENLRHWSAEDEGYAVSFSVDNKTLYLFGNHDANAQRLIGLDLATR